MDVTVKTKASTTSGYGDNAKVEPLDIEMSRDENCVINVKFGYMDVAFTPEQMDDFLNAVELVKKY